MTLGDIIYRVIDRIVYDKVCDVYEYNCRVDIYITYFGFDYHHIVRNSVLAD
jgi:hypothetical protein